MRAYVFRCSPNNGHRQDTSACPFCHQWTSELCIWDIGFEFSEPYPTERFASYGSPSTERIGRRILVKPFLGLRISMPLTRGRIGGHDNERLAFAFSMMNGGETVECQISDAAMDELAEVRGTPSIARQAQFVAHRDAIEQIASDLFDKAPTIKGYVVRIFSKHIQDARRVI